MVPDKKYVKQTKIVPKRIKFVRKNSIVIPILSVISDGGAETDQRGAETEKLVPKTPKLEVPKKVPKRVETYEMRCGVMCGSYDET